MSNKDNWSEYQMDLFFFFFMGIFFILSIFAILELPTVIIYSSSLIPVVIYLSVIILLIYFNWSQIKFMAYRWMLAKKFADCEDKNELDAFCEVEE